MEQAHYVPRATLVRRALEHLEKVGSGELPPSAATPMWTPKTGMWAAIAKEAMDTRNLAGAIAYLKDELLRLTELKEQP